MHHDWIWGDIGPTWHFFHGGWLFYIVVMTLVATFLAASAIDMELFIIPLEMCWFVTIIGFICAAVGPFVLPLDPIKMLDLFPYAGESPKLAAVAFGGGIGLILSLIGLKTGLIKPSYEMDEQKETDDIDNAVPFSDDHDYNDRLEVLKETLFILPVVIGAVIALKVTQMPTLAGKWAVFIELPVVSGLLGSLAGYLVGCAVVWATRIFGTLAFNKEAMGLGDVHLMGAAGAVIGAQWVALAFFLAPFFGIAWALYQAIFKKMRQIPYGPFLSMAVFAVIIFHDWIQNVLTNLYGLKP